MFTKLGVPPRHYYVNVDSRYSHEKEIGLQEAMWTGITAISGRAWGINVIFRMGGMMYRNLPPNAIAFTENPAPEWSLDQAQAWNCYSDHFTVLEDPVLSGMRISVKTCAGIYTGEYMFVTTHMEDGWSAAPEQDKMFVWCKLDNGRMTIQPNNHIVFEDSSFIINLQQLPKLMLQTVEYKVGEKQNYKYDF